MKKVLVLSVVAIAIFAVASFASLSFSGTGSVSWYLYPFQNNFVSTSPSFTLSAAGTDYSFSASFSPWSVLNFYLTVPLMTNLSLLTGYDSMFGETVFSGSNVNSTGSLSFGNTSTVNFTGLEYTSSSFNLYAETTGLSATSTVGLLGDAPLGPVHLYAGMTTTNLSSSTAANYSLGANVSLSPVNLFGLVNMASGALSSYTFGGALNLGSNQAGLEYGTAGSTSTLTGWFDLGSNNELNASITNMKFSTIQLNLTANNLFTLMGATGSLSGSYSSSSWKSSLKLSGNVPNTKGNVTWSLTPSYSSTSGLSVTSSFTVSAF